MLNTLNYPNFAIWPSLINTPKKIIIFQKRVSSSSPRYITGKEAIAARVTAAIAHGRRKPKLNSPKQQHRNNEKRRHN